MLTIAKQLLAPVWPRLPRRIRRVAVWLGTPKVVLGVSAVVLNPRNEMLLLLHHFRVDYPWGLPGGFVGRGEAPVPALLRELREETGLTPEVVGILAVERIRNQLQICYLCRVPAIDPQIDRSEIVDFRWVDPLTCDMRFEYCHTRAIAVVNAQLSGKPHPHFSGHSNG